MSRIRPIDPQRAEPKTAKLFESVRGKLGSVPNMMRAMGNSPATLGAYLQFSSQLAIGVLTAQQRELIALAVGEVNQCDYCLAAHSALGKMAGLSGQQIEDARRGASVDSKDEALVRLATKLVHHRGHVSDQDLAEFRDHGFGDAAISEVVANVALNVFTNYFNHVAETEIDFPAAPSLSAA